MSSASPPAPFADDFVSIKHPSSQSVTSAIKKQPSGSARRQHPLDAKFGRLIRDILPSAPYLLRLRNRSAQYNGRDRYYWRKDTHFDEDEEELQYLTFRPTHDGTILYAQGQWDDGNGGIAPKDFPSSQASSGRTPLVGQVATKKITLADYAKLDRSKSRTPKMSNTGTNENVGKASEEAGEVSKMQEEKVAEDANPNAESVSVLMDAEDTIKVTENKNKAVEEKKQDVEAKDKDVEDENEDAEDKIKNVKEKSKDGQDKKKDAEEKDKAADLSHKRSVDTMSSPSEKPALDHEIPSSPLSKSFIDDEVLKEDKDKDKSGQKLELENTKPTSTQPPQAEEHGQSVTEKGKAPTPEIHIANAEAIPEEKHREAILHGLPPMLSPTLPADIEEELAKRSPGLHGGFASSRVSSASPQPHSKDEKRNASIGLKSTSTPSNNANDPKQITSAPRQDPKDEASSMTEQVAVTKNTKIVKLRIRNKANRRTLMQYLRMKPTPNRGSRKMTAKSSTADAPSNSNVNKGSSQSKLSKSTKLPEEDESSADEPLAQRKSGKRRAAEFDDDDFGKGTAKRVKGAGQQQQDRSSKKSTPLPTGTSRKAEKLEKEAASTPKSTLPNSAQKSHLNVMGTAMQRTASQESAATPARDVTPTANGHKPVSPERREWKKDVKIEMNHLLKLATDIKHDSDVYLKHLEGSEYEKYRQLGSVIATEAILSFMLAATVSDEPGRSSNTHSNTDLWKSTRTFIMAMSSTHARKFQHLSGFLKQIEGVVCDTLTYQYDMRGEAILKEYNRLKQQEGPVSTPTNSNSYIAENWEFFKETQETRVRARAAWREGQMALFDHELEREFPKTWARRRDYAGRGKGRDPVTLKNYAKEGFALPLSVNTTALEAVNFGLSFLAELCEKEKLDWKPKLII